MFYYRRVHSIARGSVITIGFSVAIDKIFIKNFSHITHFKKGIFNVIFFSIGSSSYDCLWHRFYSQRPCCNLSRETEQWFPYQYRNRKPTLRPLSPAKSRAILYSS